MKYKQILPALTDGGIRYLVVGAVGAVLSGYFRTTADLDLLVDVERPNLERVLKFMEKHEYRPRAPVPARDLLNPRKRREWHEKKNLKAFTFIDPQNPFGNIDLLIYPPVRFEEAWKRKRIVNLQGKEIFVASIQDLITLKEDAVCNRGLEKDLYDMLALQELKRREK